MAVLRNRWRKWLWLHLGQRENGHSKMDFSKPWEGQGSEGHGKTRGNIVGLSGEELSCQCRRYKRWGFSPWIGKLLWRRKWQPTLVFLPEKSHEQRSLASYGPRCRKSQTQLSTAQLRHLFLYHHEALFWPRFWGIFCLVWLSPVWVFGWVWMSLEAPGRAWLPFLSPLQFLLRLAPKTGRVLKNKQTKPNPWISSIRLRRCF